MLENGSPQPTNLPLKFAISITTDTNLLNQNSIEGFELRISVLDSGSTTDCDNYKLLYLGAMEPYN